MGSTCDECQHGDEYVYPSICGTSRRCKAPPQAPPLPSPRVTAADKDDALPARRLESTPGTLVLEGERGEAPAIGAQASILDWTMLCPDAAAALLLVARTTEPQASAFRQAFASSVNQQTGHMFFPRAGEDVRMQGGNGCLHDLVHCSHGEALARDPQTCLFPSGSLFATPADCPRWSPALPWSSLLVFAALLVCCCLMVACGMRSVSKRESEARRWSWDSDTSPHQTDEGEDSDSEGSDSDAATQGETSRR